MSHDRQTMLGRLQHGQQTPALRQIRELASAPATKLVGGPIVQPAGEVLSVWSIRLWNAMMRGRRIVGLADLVRSLHELSPEHKIEQRTLRNGQKTGLVFFDPETQRPVGAVVAVQTEADGLRSYTNYEVAMGTSVSAPVGEPAAHWNRKIRRTVSKPSLAALAR